MEEYFKFDDLAYDVWSSKYKLNDESLEEFFQRLVYNFKRPFSYHEDLSEYGKRRLQHNYKDILHNLFKDFKFTIPGGSVLSGIGSGKPVSLSNCTLFKLVIVYLKYLIQLSIWLIFTKEEGE